MIISPRLRHTLARHGLVFAIAGFGLFAVASAWYVTNRNLNEPSGTVGAAGDRTPGTLAPGATVNASVPRGELGGPALSVLGTPLGELYGLDGPDLADHLGERVRIVADLGQALNDVAFWSGSPPNDLLVVMGRDSRAGPDRQSGRGSTTNLASGSGPVTLLGTIEPVPYAEATFSWGLTRHDVARLADRGVYVRARRIVSRSPDAANERLSAEEVDEFGRETAPPPGEEIETGLGLPPPRP